MQKENFEQNTNEQVVKSEAMSSKKYFILESNVLKNGIKRLGGVDTTRDFKMVLYYDLKEKKPRMMLVYEGVVDKDLAIINDITDYIGISTNTHHKKLQTTLYDEKDDDFVDLDHQPEFYFSINPAPEDRNNHYKGNKGNFIERILRFEFLVIELYEDEYRCVITKKILRKLPKDQESIINSSKVIALDEIGNKKDDLLKKMERTFEKEKKLAKAKKPRI